MADSGRISKSGGRQVDRSLPVLCYQGTR